MEYNPQWNKNSNNVSKKIEIPDSSLFSYYVEESRILLDTYFKKNFKNFKDYKFECYLRKCADLVLPGPYAYYKEYEKKFQINSLIKTGSPIADLILNSSNKKINHHRVNFISKFICYSVLSVLFLLIFFIKNFLISLFTKSELKPEKILFIRKKDYPDAGMKEILFSSLKNTSKSSVITGFSIKKSKYNFNYLNEYNGASYRSFVSFLRCLIILPQIIKTLSYNRIPSDVLKLCIRDAFISINIVNLKSKIMVGNLVDKPIFVLLSKYKHHYQRMLSINESFLYKPFRSFDYNFLDKYYSMNSIDEKMQNRFGGEIKKFKKVSFFRKNHKTLSKGISDDLQNRIKNYKNIILACTVQIGVNDFFWYDKKDLVKFLNSISRVAEVYDDSLIIIKGKKEELNYVENEIKKLESYSNVFVVKSDKPKLLKYNQFDDLIKISTLMISLHTASTTVWESYANNKPVILFNETHEKTWLSKYKNVEVSKEELLEAISYWLTVSKSIKFEFFKEINNIANMGSFNGLEEIANDIDLMLSAEN